MAITDHPSGAAEQRAAARAAFFRTPNKPLRPLLTFVNGDNCWLVSIPIPASERASNPKGRSYFHVITDPWLFGKAIYRSNYLLTYTQNESPEIPNVAAISDEIRNIEAAAAAAAGQSLEAQQKQEGVQEDVDAILISDNDAPDHLNKETLLTFPAEVPLYVDAKRAHEPAAWGHFKTIVPLSVLDKTHSLTAETPLSSYHPGGPLPKWITFFRLQGPIMPSFSAVIVFESPCEPTADGGKTCHEMILYTPHAQPADYPPLINLVTSQHPPMRNLALLTPLTRSTTARVATQPGAYGQLEVERLMKPKYWLPTADGYLNVEYTYGGALSWVLNLIPDTIENGLAEEEKKTGKRGETPNFLIIKNGECLVLDV